MRLYFVKVTTNCRFYFIVIRCAYIYIGRGDFNIEHQSICKQYSVNHELLYTAIKIYKLNIVVVQNSFYNRLEIRHKNLTLLLYRIVFQMRLYKYRCVHILYITFIMKCQYMTHNTVIYIYIQHRGASEPK